MRLIKFFILCMLLASGFVTTTSQADSVFIVTAPPIPRDVVMQPRGYEKCYDIPSGWYHGVWVNRHRVCQYSHVRRPQVWVDGYWKCDRFNRYSGRCAHWHWIRSHWAHHNVIY